MAAVSGMGSQGVTFTCSAGTCTLDSTTVDYLLTLLQVIAVAAGALVGLAVVVAFAAFWKRL